MRLTHFAGQDNYALYAFVNLRTTHTIASVNYKGFLLAFGRSLKDRRKSLQKTQAEIADMIGGLDQSGLSRMERGEQGFDSDTLFQLAGALDSPIHRLFGGYDAPEGLEGLSPDAIDMARQWQELAPEQRATVNVVLASLHTRRASDRRSPKVLAKARK